LFDGQNESVQISRYKKGQDPLSLIRGIGSIFSNKAENYKNLGSALQNDFTGTTKQIVKSAVNGAVNTAKTAWNDPLSLAHQAGQDPGNYDPSQVILNMASSGLPLIGGATANALDKVIPENIKLPDLTVSQNLEHLEFSGAPLVQGELKAWSLLKGDLSTPIYRLSGGDAPLDGRSWTTLDPRTFSSMDEYKIAAGIGDWNTAETLSIGT
tara:strand:- start:617 stop:1249 length:633 start_codon:yes stop_codon:yes gene_type:complete